MEWTEETILRLRGFWAEGVSTAEIGRRLGVSKNAVVGKAHRLDLTARPSPIHWDRDGQAPRPRRPASAPRPSGPTLPPLGSARVAVPASAPAGPASAGPALAGMPSAGMASGRANPAAPPARPPATQAATMAAQVLGRTIPPPPRPVAAPPPRLHAVTPRPYGGRVVTCCWPLGEPGTKDFHFCDGSSVPGKPYCEEHAQLAYVKVRDRREDAA